MSSNVTEIDKRRRYPIAIVWAPYQDGRTVPIVFDHKVRLIEEFAQFALYEAKEHLKTHAVSAQNEQAYISTINPIAYTLKSFATYLADKRFTWSNISDAELGDYKIWELKRVLEKPSARTVETAQETVNVKLKVIYKYFWWAQEERALISGRIGWPQAPIRSRLVEYMRSPESFSDSIEALKGVYPLLYQRTGARSKYKKGHYATDEEVEALRDYYRRHSSVQIADRNILIVDIIEERGWRGGSVRSLMVNQFSDEIINDALKKNASEILVTPATQKNSRRTSYPVRLPLAIRINHFCKTTRKQILDTLGKGEKEANGIVFIGETTGQPLGKSRISRIIAEGFKSIGAPKGAGGHSIRRKYGKDCAKEVIEIRKRLGFSIDPADTVMDIAERLGHESLAAQSAYTAGKTDVYKTTTEEDLHRKNSELRAKLAQKELEIAEIKKKLRRFQL